MMGVVKRHFLWAALFSALANLLFLAPTLYMLQIYDRVVPTRGGTTLAFLTVALLLAYATLSLLEYIRSRILVRASIGLDRRLARTLIAATLRQQAGEGIGRRSRQPIRECDQLRQTLTGPAMFALFDAPWTPIYILVCALIHPLIGLMALAGSLTLVAIAWASDRATRRPLLQANAAANLSYSSQEQTMQGAEAVRALGMQGAMVRRHLTEREDMLGWQAEASFAAGSRMAVSRFLRNMLQSGALGLGALLAIDGQISGGAIFASSFLLGRAVAPVDQLVGSWRSFVAARASHGEVMAWLDGAADDMPQTSLPRPKGQVDVERVTIEDPHSQRLILNNLSFAVGPGEMVAVIGASGAGKSTLARLVAGAIACDRGEIRIDGAERSQWDGDALAVHVGYMPQQLSLFAGSIRDNIARFADPDADARIDADVIAAAQACGVHEMILRLPQGYDTMLGWGGMGLSMGQTQRIALARALFRDPAVLILDEPNAHLDSDGEAQLIAALARAKARGAAIMVTAHRTGLLGPADRILVLDNGRMRMSGPRDQVLGALTRPRPAPVAGAA
ncbi:type I secretion system permease/ATPase [Sphingobium sp. SA916]|uniref:type I secretion system permease/ATPase n=1 Tax=Sphingobium sp. SA916 TaxID=1851207 RepID=UPI000C9FB169|nr:type I secretion system permease/ATPase [Sphingobium sp. SA916]PNQ00671.1 ABC transporter ATP-binding protein [Sphingobium sp. SA916]